MRRFMLVTWSTYGFVGMSELFVGYTNNMELPHHMVAASSELGHSFMFRECFRSNDD